MEQCLQFEKEEWKTLEWKQWKTDNLSKLCTLEARGIGISKSNSYFQTC